jgi:GNAT superfamily N-acetyltransferase
MDDHHILELRQAESRDAQAITGLVRAAYSKWVPVIGREPQPMLADYERAVREHDIALLYSGARLIGLIEMVGSPDHLWIENIAVAPEKQGKGFGKLLLRHAEQLAINTGCGELRLLTNEAFETNIGLYSGFGFAVDRKEPFMGGVTVYMSKKLVLRKFGGVHR